MKYKLIALLQKANDESFIDELNKKAGESLPQEYSRANSVWELFGLIIILLLILLAAYFISRFISKLKLGQLSKSNFEIFNSIQIASNKSLMIVKVGTRYILISVTKEHIQYLTELEEEDIKLINSNIEEKNTFKNILDNIKNTKKEEE